MFFTSEAKQAFIELKETFVKAPILNHFDPEHHIYIKIDDFGYAISEIFSQLTLNDLG